MADAGPSRGQLFKLGLGVFAFALFLSCSILVIVFLASQAGSGKVMTAAMKYGQGVSFVAGCLAMYIGLWRYIRKRIVQIHGASGDERALKSRIRVAFWSYLSGWVMLLGANVLLVVVMIRELFRAA